MRIRCVLLSCAVASVVVAQEPTVATLPPPPPPTVTSAAPAVSEAPVGSWLDADTSPQPLLGLDLMLGQQFGIRPKLAVWRDDNRSFVVEGFYGATATKIAASEAAGLGVRYILARPARNSCNTVTVGPGLDMLFNFADGQATILAPTVDVAWKHSFGERSGWVLGANVGVGVGLSGRDDDRQKAAGQVTPLISVFTGLRF